MNVMDCCGQTGSVCGVALQFACIKVMVASADNHVLGERVNSWAILTGLVRGKDSQRMAWRCVN